ncbi:hypothetical protein SAMN05428959_1011020 [Duganella sp. CF517]|uniref:hypothetical protein n=1 Tax=Duganella sp. CF517 TaxID=1881038 RepID=UPI0008ABFCFD|nr:hypothetical protein [Duganella sp. CF517]SEN28671.1 hypothetical protein SAMN05428959_1011020 [Duganella sp. CF517]
MLAKLTLQSLVPVAIDDRYLTPALPAYTALAALGVLHVATALRGWLARRRTMAPPADGRVALGASALLALAMLAPDTEVYALAGDARADIGAVRRLGVPAKGAALSNAAGE